MSALTKMVLDKARSFPSLVEAADFFGCDFPEVVGWTEGKQVPLSAVEKVFDVTKLVPKVGDVAEDDKKVCILLPWYKQTNPATAFSVMSCLDRTKMSIMLNFGDAFVAHTRNSLATAFLRSTSPWALTIDDDSILPCGNAAWFNGYTEFGLPDEYAGLNTVNRLLSHGKTLVGGLYFGRWRSGKPVFGEGGDKAVERHVRSGPHDKVIPTRWIGTGCLLIHRSVFLAIEDKFPHLARNKDGNFGNWFSSSEHDLQLATSEALSVLNDTSVAENLRIEKVQRVLTDARLRAQKNTSLGIGEDVIFSVRAAQAGHQPYVDLGCIVGHQGSCVYGPKKLGWVK